MSRYVCSKCGKCLASRHSLSRHKNHHCKSGEKLTDEESCGAKRRRISVVSTVNKNPELDYDIPTFDGDEFCGNKPKSRETLNRMMKMMKIPEHRWAKIATGILQDEHNIL